MTIGRVVFRSMAAILPALSAGSAESDPPAFEAPRLVLSGDAPIDVDRGHATPEGFDWDGDGLVDLLVGQFDGGKLRLYRNVGTRREPRFEGFKYVKAGGSEASVPTS
jgi:hypothetical protein